jgi:hypothetical protein
MDPATMFALALLTAGICWDEEPETTTPLAVPARGVGRIESPSPKDRTGCSNDTEESR